MSYLRFVSGTDTAFLTQVRFVFYPGSGNHSICLPVSLTLDDFPFTAQLGDQLVAVSEGNRLPDEYDLPEEGREVMGFRWGP